MNAEQEKFRLKYEAETGEKVLFLTLGKYLSGWEAEGEDWTEALWGLLIVTDAAFRFHHFPNHNLLGLFRRGSDDEEAQTFALSRGRILRAELFVEKRLLRRLFCPSPPVFSLSYRKSDGTEAVIKAEVDMNGGNLVSVLQLP